MRKWLRNGLCFLLALTMMLVTISPIGMIEANAQDDTTKVSITGIAHIAPYGENMSYLCEMYLVTDRSWSGTIAATSGQKIGIGDSQYSLYNMANGKDILGDKVLIFNHFYSNQMEGKVITIPAGITFTHEGTTYEIKEDFKFHKKDGAWVKYEEPAPQPPAGNEKVSITGIAHIAPYGENMSYLCEMYLVTDRSWSGTIAATSGQEISIGDSQYGLYSMANGKDILGDKVVIFNHFYSNQMEGKVITIPAGITFTHEGTTYEIKEDFKFHKKDGAWVKYEEPTPQPPAEPTKVNITGIEALAVYPATHALAGLAEMYFTTDTTWATAGTNSGKTIQVNGSDVSSTVNTHNASGLLLQHWAGANMDNGNVVMLPAGLQFQAGDVTYEIATDFSFKYTKGTSATNGTYEIVGAGNPNPPTPVNADVTINSFWGGGATEIYLVTNLGNSHEFAGNTFDTTAITVTRGGQDTNINKLQVFGVEGGSIHVTHEFQSGDILKIKSTGTATNAEKAYTMTFANDFALQYDGSKWAKYVEQPPTPPTPVNADVNVPGALVTTNTELYLKTNLSDSHEFANAKFATTDITITRGGNTTAIPNGFTLVTAEGICNIYFSDFFQAGDIVKIKNGGTATNEEKAYTIKFTNDFALQYDGSKWGTYIDPDESANYSYEKITLGGIFVQGGNDLYLKTGLADTHKYKGLAFIPSGIQVLKADGTTDKLARFSMHPDTGNLYMAFSYVVEEGMGIHIPNGATGVNVDKKCGVKFIGDFSLFYTDGKWVVDNDAPVITYRGEELIADSLYGLRLGMTQAEVEALFAANDAIQGKKKVSFTYPTDMFGADGKLQKGTFKMTVSASDNSGNVAKHTIRVKGYSKDAPTITFKGSAEREFDAGKKFDTASLKATAKDGNGKKLSVKFSYSKGALDKKGALKKGSHKLYLTATDDEGQSFTKAITLNCYVFTNVKVTGFYYFLNDELYISTNMQDPTPFKGSWLTSNNILINDKSGAIPWVAVDQNTGSLYIICKKQAGDVMMIAEGATFLDEKTFVGIRVENNFKAHTDGIGWIVDRIPRGRGSGSTGSTGSPTTGDTTPWCGYAGALILAAGVMFVVQKKKKQS